ncbi:MAG TPA: Ig domain-containing protein [Jatrophihabitans sp.]|nr:Ig domain-containing protein [Jatrophihabitans sp.]
MLKIPVRPSRAGVVVGVASLAAIAFTGIATTGSASAASTANPYSPSYGHPYRHGALPTLGTLQKMKNYAHTHPDVAATTGPETLAYGGGTDGIGVNSGHNKTYLVFYGNQWGTQTTDANGNAKFSGDPDSAAGPAQQMFKGIGTNNELWSADLTQWCDGAVATLAVACPASGASYVPYQTGGVLAGVWYDNTVASPSAATGYQLGQEAIKAAAHFGNTSAASNRYSYYVILSPHGTDPDNYLGSYCAWHDYNGDPYLTGGPVPSSYGDIAFSNQPYNMDYGAGCGVGFINSPGTLDGWTITLGHEWHEMMSDKNPAGGWTNHTGSSYNGEENSDECAWLAPGTSGGVANVSFGSYGTYAEQASWSNDTNNCAISHVIVSHSSITVTNPGNQTGTAGVAKSLQMSASGGTAPYTWSATGLPAGMSINASTGLISGTPTTAATYSVTVTAKDSTGATGSTSFSWTITSGGGGNEVLGCGFDSGPWTANSCNISGTLGDIDVANFVPHNLSGTYTMSWTVTGPSGTALSNCSSTVTYNCLSGGCTSTSTYCNVTVRTGKNDHTYNASLKLTQSGVTKTISASAVVYGDSSGNPCPLC